jgi:hypothetical protein
VERPGEVVVAAAVEGPDPVDRVRVRTSENDDRNVGRAPAEVGDERVGGEDEVGPGELEQGDRLAVDGLDHLEAVLAEMALQEAARRGFGLGEQQGVRHAGDATAETSARPDVLSRRCAPRNPQRPWPPSGPRRRARGPCRRRR